MTLRKRVVCLLFSLLVLVNFSYSFGQNNEEEKKYEIEFEFDPYYSDVSFYLSLTKKPIPFLGEQNELYIYKNLLYDSPLPRFFLLELSVYPLPCLGVYLKKNHSQFYTSANIGEDGNIIQSICTGFEEPYAVSVFLGNVVSFKPKLALQQVQGYEGKGYCGYLFSAGNYQIKDSELIKDNWYELEWKIKGDRIAPERKMKWSFRIGAKFHKHREIKDVVYFSLLRDRVDYETRIFSLFKNTEFEYRFDVDNKNWKIIRHFFLAGKSFPFGKKKSETPLKRWLVFKLRLGFLWEGEEKYTGSLARAKKEDYFQFLFQPNVEF